MNGEYLIQPNTGKPPFTAYCEMKLDGGGWTVIQRRTGSTVTFDRTWSHYKNGFGNASGDLWLGNDHLYDLTNSFYATLRTDVNDYQGNSVYSEHTVVTIGNEESKYLLTIKGLYVGNDSNALSAHNNMMFTTKDNDNDMSLSNCAQYHKGGFWYKNCVVGGASPNGIYTGNKNQNNSGIFWMPWKGTENMKSVQIMIRPANYGKQNHFCDWSLQRSDWSQLQYTIIVLHTLYVCFLDCKLKTTNGKCCHIPFFYKQKVYYKCTTTGTFLFPYLWCSYQYDYPGNEENVYWGKCLD